MSDEHFCPCIRMTDDSSALPGCQGCGGTGVRRPADRVSQRAVVDRLRTVGVPADLPWWEQVAWLIAAIDARFGDPRWTVAEQTGTGEAVVSEPRLLGEVRHSNSDQHHAQLWRRVRGEVWRIDGEARPGGRMADDDDVLPFVVDVIRRAGVQHHAAADLVEQTARIVVCDHTLGTDGTEEPDDDGNCKLCGHAIADGPYRAETITIEEEL